MMIGYESERLHHALHPLFLTINPESQWAVSEDDGKMDWYFASSGEGFLVRQGQHKKALPADLYAVKREIDDYFYREEKLHCHGGLYPEFARLSWQDRFGNRKI